MMELLPFTHSNVVLVRSVRATNGEDGGQVRAIQGQKRQVPVPVEGRQRRVIAVGEAYESKASAKNGIESVQKNAAGAAIVDLTE